MLSEKNDSQKKLRHHSQIYWQHYWLGVIYYQIQEFLSDNIQRDMYIKTHAVNSQQEFIYCIYYIVKYVHEMRTMFKHDGGHTIVWKYVTMQP